MIRILWLFFARRGRPVPRVGVKAKAVLVFALLLWYATSGFLYFELPNKPAPDKAVVYVVRPSELGGLVRFNVFLGDQEPSSEMGFTRGGQYIYFNLPAGKQRLFSKAENAAEIEVDAKPGEVIYLQQEPAMGILFARNSILRIEELPGKYHVKMLKPGTILKTDK